MGLFTLLVHISECCYNLIITVPSHGPSDVLGLANSNKTG